MSGTLTILDETPSGTRTGTLTIKVLSERITVRELIRARIYEEVQDYNLKEPDLFHGLVQPTDAERALNGFRMKTRRKIDWEAQYQKAVDAFERNGFFVLVGGRQAETLDDEFDVNEETEVSFIKLLPLVGG